jgi:hypothetical protein
MPNIGGTMRNRPTPCIALLSIILLISSRAVAQSAASDADPRTIETLKKFIEQLDWKNDAKALRQLDEISKQIADPQLASVEKFAVSDDAKSCRFLFVRLLVDRDRYDAAAHVIVKSLSEVDKDRDYMWKWWETMYGDRNEYKKMSHQIVDSLLRIFEKGNESEKLIVANIFRKSEKEAKLNVEEFKKAIGYKDSEK